MARPQKVPWKADSWQICLFWRKSAALFSLFFVNFSSRMAPRRLKISRLTTNFIWEICFSMARPPKVPGKADNWQICLFWRKNAALFSHFFVIFRLEWHLGGWYFQGKPEILFPKYVLVWPDPRKGQGRQIIGKSVFFGGKAPHFFHRFLSFFRLEWHLGGWKFQGKPEILFQKYVSVWPDPRKCQGRQIIGKSVFFCGTVLPFGRHFLDSNST